MPGSRAPRRSEGFDVAPDPGRPRLNLLLSYGGWSQQSWAEQVGRLLQPLGVQSITVGSGRQAADVIRTTRVHVAVVDVRIPLDEPTPGEGGEAAAPARAVTPAGLKLLELLRRLERTPPTVLVRPNQPDPGANLRTLTEALRGGAFSVVDHPVQVETLLRVIRRVIQRHYADAWPSN